MSSLSVSKRDLFLSQMEDPDSGFGLVTGDSGVGGLGTRAGGAGSVFTSDPPQPKNANGIMPRERTNVRLNDVIDICDSLTGVEEEKSM